MRKIVPQGTNGQRVFINSDIRNYFPEIAAFFRQMNYNVQPGGPVTRRTSERRWATH